MAQTCVGIDLGSYSIKVAEIKSSSKGLALVRLEEYPLSLDIHQDRKIEIIELLLRLSNEYTEDVQFILGVQQRLVSVRLCRFPFRERHKILKSVSFELEDEIPFTQEDAIFDVKVVQHKGHQAEVLAIACPKNYVRDLIELCQDSSIKPHILSVGGLATANIFGRWVGISNPLEDNSMLMETEEMMVEEGLPGTPPTATSSSRVVLQMGHTSSVLMIFKEEVLFDVRHIDFGGYHVAEAIAEHYKISFTEALHELRAKPYVLLSHEGATKEQIIFSNIIKRSFHYFSIQVRLTLLEDQARFNLKYVEVSMTGGLSRIKNIGAYLTQTIEIPTNRLKYISPIPEVEMESEESTLVWGLTAVGLAMEGFKRPKNPATNLLQGEFAIKGDGFQHFWEKWSYTVQVCAVAFVLFCTFALIRYNLAVEAQSQVKKQVKKQAKVIAGLKGRQAREKKIKALIKSNKKISKSMSSAKKIQKLTSAMEILKQVSEAVPSKSDIGLNIKSMTILRGDVTLVGEVGQSSHLISLLSGLKKIAKGSQVETLKPSQSPSKKGQVAFSYKFKMNFLSEKGAAPRGKM